jgi:hypothetical protein
MTETSEEERTQKLASLSHDCRRSRSKTLNKVLKNEQETKGKHNNPTPKTHRKPREEVETDRSSSPDHQLPCKLKGMHVDGSGKIHPTLLEIKAL